MDTQATEQTKPDYGKMTVPQLARVIQQDWKNVYFSAVPYLRAMLTGDYGWDGEKSVVTFFIVNAGTWRGETAKAVKKALKNKVGLK